MVVQYNYNTSFTPKYNFPSYRLGAPTSPMSPKQVEDFGRRLNEGIQNVEIGTLKEETFETIPKEHFETIRQLSKLTDSNISMHAPLIEPSGFGERDWTKQRRIENEKRILSVLERAHDAEKNGNIPVVVHAAGVFGQEWEKGLGREMEEYGQKRKIEPIRTLGIVNQSTGEITAVKYEERIPAFKKEGEAKPEIFDPQRRVDSMNLTMWDDEKLKVFSQQKQINELNDRKGKIFTILQPKLLEIEKRSKNSDDPELGRLYSEARRLQSDADQIEGHIHTIRSHNQAAFREMHNKVEKYADKGSKEFKAYREELKNVQGENNQVNQEMLKVYNSNLPESEKKQMLYELDQKRNGIILKNIAIMPIPEIWTPIKDFAVEKASTTISNVAFDAYKKYGDKAPTIALENWQPNAPMSTAEELRKGIEESRKKFVDRLVKEKNIKEDKAEEIASKLIGATWDVGHINVLKKGGYTDKDIIEETKKIAPYIKELHLTDNFGFADTHLAPGMGTVPIKEILEATEKELEKKGWNKEKINKLRAIVEAGAFAKEFELSPTQDVLEYFGSPLYTMGPSPYWQRDVQGVYSMGYGKIFPQQHFDMYGSSFSALPKELGGAVAGGDKSRFAQSQE